jgi:hypothetical protein
MMFLAKAILWIALATTLPLVGCPSPRATEQSPERESTPTALSPTAAAPSPTEGESYVGQALTDSVPLVDGVELVTSPERFAGQQVRIAGEVKGFCHHARSWFAVDVPGAHPPYVRLVTAPRFRVPGDVMGAHVEAVGVVQVQQVPRGQAAHYEHEHRLGARDDDDPGDTVARVVIQATGARFRRPPS